MSGLRREAGRGGGPDGEGRPRILVLVGTRPEAVKMAPVVSALGRRRDSVETRVALTGQHTTLVDQVLEAFRLEPEYDLEIEPSWDLGVMREGQSLYDLAHACLDGLREVVAAYRPDLVLVQGDTATVFFGALVAFLEGARVGHVEAGLRSGDKWAPFPEEIFRRLTDVLTDLHFAPTPAARDNLLREGVAPGRVLVTGNTVVDAVRSVAGSAREVRSPSLRRLLEGQRPFVLLTAHRRESFGEPIRAVFRAVRDIVDAEEGVEVLYPVHPNPHVREPAEELLGDHPRIHLTEPLDYVDLVRALGACRLVLTDSGGIQEEAPSLGTPVLVLRGVTERPEALDAGVARLVGTDRTRIVEETLRLLRDAEAREAMAPAGAENPFGDGRAGERIADALVAHLRGEERRMAEWDGRTESADAAASVEGR